MTTTTSLTESKKFRAGQILGFVNLTLKRLPNTKTPTQDQAQYLIQAAMINEQDQEVIDYCNSKFQEWYNCKG